MARKRADRGGRLLQRPPLGGQSRRRSPQGAGVVSNGDPAVPIPQETRSTTRGPAHKRSTDGLWAILSGRPRLASWLARLAWLSGIVLVCAVYMVLKMYAMHPYLGDEHIYNYQAQLIADGMTPYAEFAMAHPPLQALFAGLVFKIIGFDLTAARLFPILWSLAGGILLAVLVRREIGRLASVVAAALFLLSYEPLRASSHFTGVNMTVALLLAAFLAYRWGAIRSSAVLCVAAVFTRLYAIPGVVVLTLWAFIEDWRKGVKLTAWGAGTGLAASVSLGIWAGFGPVVHNLITYHAQKTPMSAEGLRRQNLTVLFHNAPTAFLFLAGLLALLALGTLAYLQLYHRAKKAGQPGRLGVYGWIALATYPVLAAAIGFESFGLMVIAVPASIAVSILWAVQIRQARTATGPGPPGDELAGGGLLILSAVTSLVFLAVLLHMDRVWMYYYIPAFPFAAVVGGWMVSLWVGGSSRLLGNLVRLRRPGMSWPRLAGGGLLLAAYLWSWWYSPNLERYLRYYEQSMAQSEEDRVHTYTWRPGLLPGFVDRLVHDLWWQDERIIGQRYHRFNYLLWHESRIFDRAEEMAQVIRSNTGEQDAIFGDSSSVPLLALLADRRIAANEVDTNVMRYRSGYMTPQELIERIDGPRTRIVVLANNIGVGSVQQVMQWVRARYRSIGSYVTAQDRTLSIYLRRSDE